jgi:hypothetical protein
MLDGVKLVWILGSDRKFGITMIFISLLATSLGKMRRRCVEPLCDIKSGLVIDSCAWVLKHHVIT